MKIFFIMEKFNPHIYRVEKKGSDCVWYVLHYVNLYMTLLKGLYIQAEQLYSSGR